MKFFLTENLIITTNLANLEKKGTITTITFLYHLVTFSLNALKKKYL